MWLALCNKVGTVIIVHLSIAKSSSTSITTLQLDIIHKINRLCLSSVVFLSNFLHTSTDGHDQSALHMVQGTTKVHPLNIYYACHILCMPWSNTNGSADKKLKSLLCLSVCVCVRCFFFQVKIKLPDSNIKDVELDITDTYLDCRTPK